MPTRVTDMEREAAKEARNEFAAVLVKLNLMSVFEGRPAHEIDEIILACAEGVRRGLQKLSAMDPSRVPF